MDRSFAAYLKSINATDNPVLERTLLYEVNRASDLGRANLLATETQLTGLATFTPAEVRTLKVPVAALVAATSRDHDLLHKIAVNETRISVRRGLGRNPHLPSKTVAHILGHPSDPAGEEAQFAVNHWSMAKLMDSLWRPYELDSQQTKSLVYIAWRRLLRDASPDEQVAWSKSAELTAIVAHASTDGATWDEYLDLVELEPCLGTRLRYLCMTINIIDNPPWDVPSWERVLQWDSVASKTSQTALPVASGIGHQGEPSLEWGMGMLDRAVHPTTRKLILITSGTLSRLTPEYVDRLSPQEACSLMHGYRYSVPHERDELNSRLLMLVRKSVSHLVNSEVLQEDASQTVSALGYLFDSNVDGAVPELFRYLDVFHDDVRQILSEPFDGDAPVSGYQRGALASMFGQLLFNAGMSTVVSAEQRQQIYDLLSTAHRHVLQDRDLPVQKLLQPGCTIRQQIQVLVIRARTGEGLREKYSQVEIAHLLRLYELEYPGATEETFNLLMSMATDWDPSLGELVDTVHALSS